MAEIDPISKAPTRESTGDPELDSLLLGVERVAENEIERNGRILDNQLLASDRIIANIATLNSISGNNELIKLALEAAIQNPQ